MSQMEALLKNLTDTIAFLQEISVVEEEKFQAATQNRILAMEDCIKKEQALLLRSKGLEQKRQQLQEQFGADMLRQIIDGAAPEEKPALEAAFAELTASIKKYQEIHHRTKTIIEVNLHRINKELERMTGSPLGGSQVGYTDHGGTVQSGKNLTNRRI